MTVSGSRMDVPYGPKHDRHVLAGLQSLPGVSRCASMCIYNMNRLVLCADLANNPSESIIAKRRGYGTIVSHNVPPYGRAGLYKQLAELQGMVTEYREDPDVNQVLRRPILAALQSAGELTFGRS